MADIDVKTILLDGEVLGRVGDDLASVPLPVPPAPVTSASVVLTDSTPNSLTLVQWGTEEAVIAQADPPAAVVLANLTGMVRPGPGTITVGDRGAYQLQVSFDGGSNWSNLGMQLVGTLPIALSNARYAVASTGRATGTVTGDVQVRAMVADITAANDTTFMSGVITVLVHAQ